MLASNSRDKGFKKCSVESVITPKMIFDWQRIAMQLSWLFFENLYTFFLSINIYRSLMIKASFWNAFRLINKTKTYTAQNFVFSPNFLVWKFSENTVFPSFGRIVRNSAETCFGIISIPGNYVKLGYFMHCQKIYFSPQIINRCKQRLQKGI